MNLARAAWGDLSTWALVVVTLVGVVAAVAAGVYAGKIYRIERERDQKRDKIEGRDQAILVSGWAEIIKYEDGRSPNVGVVAVALNASSQPIYEVGITWYKENQVILVAGASVIPPATRYQWPMDEFKFLNLLLDLSHQNNPSVEDALSVVKQLRIGVAFTDAKNQRWDRGPDGLLTFNELDRGR